MFGMEQTPTRGCNNIDNRFAVHSQRNPVKRYSPVHSYFVAKVVANAKRLGKL